MTIKLQKRQSIYCNKEHPLADANHEPFRHLLETKLLKSWEYGAHPVKCPSCGGYNPRHTCEVYHKGFGWYPIKNTNYAYSGVLVREGPIGFMLDHDPSRSRHSKGYIVGGFYDFCNDALSQAGWVGINRADPYGMRYYADAGSGELIGLKNAIGVQLERENPYAPTLVSTSRNKAAKEAMHIWIANNS